MDKGKGKAVSSSDEEFDYLNCSRQELRNRISRYSTKHKEVPREVLSYVFSLFCSHLEASLLFLYLGPPYKARHALDNEHPFFPADGEVGVYLGHFMAGLSFSLDSNLLDIMQYYGLPLCRYNHASIGSKVSFLSLLHSMRLLFSVDVFHYFFIA